jgi:hypothetical protein
MKCEKVICKPDKFKQDHKVSEYMYIRASATQLERYYLSRKMQGSRPGDTRGKEKIPGHETDIQDFERKRQSQGGNIIYENE